MNEPDVPAFDATDRRTFLTRASALTLMIPAAGAALAACAPSSGGHADTGRATGAAAAGAGRGQAPAHNSDSRLDSSLLEGGRRAPPATGAAQAAQNIAYHRWDPALPPAPATNRIVLHWHAREAPVRLDDDTVVGGWTFEGDIPGPFVHCRVGDTVEFTLTNDADVPHSIDFHAAQIDPKLAFRSVPKGQSVTFRFTPRFAGAFMYHCGTSPVLMHIGSGMFGAIVVSPREPLAQAREFVLVQNEYYLGAAVNGVHPSDYQKMLNTLPDLVCFNGRPNQYIKDPIRVKVGDRVRFWVVSAGPSHACHFHVVGGQFERVYIGAPPGNAITGVQTFSVAPGGGMVYELECRAPGEFPFVNHGFGHGQKGAMGLLVVE